MGTSRKEKSTLLSGDDLEKQNTKNLDGHEVPDLHGYHRLLRKPWVQGIGILLAMIMGVSLVRYLLFGSDTAGLPDVPGGPPRFQVSLAPEFAAGAPITGRLLLCVATKNAVNHPYGQDQPRFLVSDNFDTQQLFAVDVFEFNTGIRELNDTSIDGYPLADLSAIPEGEYWVQPVLHPYVQYNRSDGYNLWLPGLKTFEDGFGVLNAPGTMFGTPQLVKIQQDVDFQQHLVIDQLAEPSADPKYAFADTVAMNKEPASNELLHHVTYKSKMLSEFWGTDVELKAWVLLPHRFYDASTTDMEYPMFIYQTHFNRDFSFHFRTSPPSESEGYDQVEMTKEWYKYYLYRNWTSEHEDGAFTGKRGIIVQLQHANPYYDDSYAVNSANIGPYGDAITYEFLPYLASKYRGINAGWGRTMYGGSTGGWESLAVQVFYPEEYNGCWSFCPDSFDFHRFQLVNLLDDTNAYYHRGDWTVKARGSRRDYLGHVLETMPEENHHEMTLGSRGRSGGQWDAWQAVYSPVNTTDGYPAAIWDKRTGEIDPTVVEYWVENYGVRRKLQREWESEGLGEKLVNKLHVYVGVTDSYYLNDGVFLLEDFLESTTAPYYNGSIVYGVEDGRGFEHCWTGSFDETLPMAYLTLNQRMVPQMVDHVAATAPEGANLGFTSY